MKITFIGGGNMASALIAGLAGKLTAGANIHVVDPNPEAWLQNCRSTRWLFTAPAVGIAAPLLAVHHVPPKRSRQRRAPLAGAVVPLRPGRQGDVRLERILHRA